MQRACLGTLAPGDVLAIDPLCGNKVMASSEANSGLVRRGLLDQALGARSWHSRRRLPPRRRRAGRELGVVRTKVSAENGPVQPGDLLTIAGTPGYAMKATPISFGAAAVYPPERFSARRSSRCAEPVALSMCW